MLTRFRRRRVHELADIADIEGDVAMANWRSVEAILGAKPGTMPITLEHGGVFNIRAQSDLASLLRQAS